MGEKRYVLGIDMGGTNISAAAIYPDGTSAEVQQMPMDFNGGPGEGIRKITVMLERIIAGEDGSPIAFGLGATGPVFPEKGIISNPYTLPGWYDIDIISPLEEALGIPGFLENDADAFALGEYWGLDEPKPERLFTMTIGTGVGSAFILRGKLYRGNRGLHPESGHMVVDMSTHESCYCGSSGCLESLVSGPAIARRARVAVERNKSVILDLVKGNPEDINAITVVQAAKAKDPTALTILEETAGYIGTALLNIILLLTPDLIVLGGGVMESYGVFKDGIAHVCSRSLVMLPGHETKIVPSRLGRKAAMAGAALTAYRRIGETSI
jgi:glucokinase